MMVTKLQTRRAATLDPSAWCLACTLASAAPACGPASSPAPDEVEPPPPAEPNEEQAPRPNEPQVSFSAVRVAADEGRFGVAARFAVDDGWHIYWHNPGDAGLATRVRIEGASTVRYPTPERFVSPGDIESFGYGDDTALFAEIVDPDASGGPVSVHATWLACKARCVRQQGTVELSRDAPVVDDPALEALRQRLPLAMPSQRWAASWNGDSLRVQVPVAGGKVVDFFPAATEPMLFEEAIYGDDGATLTWRRGGTMQPRGAQGVLVVEREGQRSAYTLDVAWPPS